MVALALVLASCDWHLSFAKMVGPRMGEISLVEV